MLRTICFALAIAWCAQATAEPARRVIVIQEAAICRTNQVAQTLAASLHKAILDNKPAKIMASFEKSLSQGCRPFSIKMDNMDAVRAEKPSFERKSVILGYDTYVRVTPVKATRGTKSLQGFLVLIGQDVTDQIYKRKA